MSPYEMIIRAVLEGVFAHFQKAGVITDAQAEQMRKDAAAEGVEKINQWFMDRGLTPPK